MTLKILALDIETAPAVAYVWGRFKQFISDNQVISEPWIMCFTYQWEGQKSVKFSSVPEDGKHEMLQLLHDLLDEADVVVHYNGKTFDVPWITGELIEAGFNPPSPFRQIDLYQVIKSRTRWLTKNLKTVSRKLLGDTKVTHNGFELWIGCINNDPKSWSLMKKYALQDTRLMLPLYERIKPWIKNHPNRAMAIATSRVRHVDRVTRRSAVTTKPTRVSSRGTSAKTVALGLRTHAGWRLHRFAACNTRKPPAICRGLSS